VGAAGVARAGGEGVGVARVALLVVVAVVAVVALGAAVVAGVVTVLDVVVLGAAWAVPALLNRERRRSSPVSSAWRWVEVSCPAAPSWLTRAVSVAMLVNAADRSPWPVSLRSVASCCCRLVAAEALSVAPPLEDPQPARQAMSARQGRERRSIG
jgi:hypothetical protein